MELEQLPKYMREVEFSAYCPSVPFNFESLKYPFSPIDCSFYLDRGLLRFDSKNPEFTRMNETLLSIDDLELEKYSHDVSLYDYLQEQGFSEEIMEMASAGYANTLCSNIKELSLRQCIIWSKLWFAEEEANEELGCAEVPPRSYHIRLLAQSGDSSIFPHTKFYAKT